MEFARNIFFCILCLVATSALSKTKMPKLALKQQIQYSRFVSKNGKYTYYQNSSGKLLLSTNFNVKPIIEGKKNTNYQVYSSSARKKIIITQDKNPHGFLGIRKPNKIFVSEFGKENVLHIGDGKNPQLHLDDTWLSYYQTKSKHIIFQHLTNLAIKFRIKIINTVNPYFVPSVAMISEKIIVFTDINEKGIPGIIEFNRTNNKTKPLFKAESFNQKIEICQGSQSIYFGLFPLSNKGTSSIYNVPLENPNFDSANTIYESPLPDIGNLLCAKDEIFFIKTIRKKNKIMKTELATIRDGQVRIVSDLGNVLQVINMDGNILIPHQSNFYIVNGNTQLDKDDLDANKE